MCVIVSDEKWRPILIERLKKKTVFFFQNLVKATRIVMLRPFCEDPLALDAVFSPYWLELPILILLIMLVASYKVILD